MLRKIYFCLVMIMLILLGVFFGGGVKPSEISRDDLKLVNTYISGVGAEPILLNAAKDINHSLMENTHTREIKTVWQMIVDYVHNEQGIQRESLGYTLVFEGGSFSIEDNESWEHIGG